MHSVRPGISLVGLRSPKLDEFSSIINLRDHLLIHLHETTRLRRTLARGRAGRRLVRRRCGRVPAALWAGCCPRGDGRFLRTGIVEAASVPWSIARTRRGARARTRPAEGPEPPKPPATATAGHGPGSATEASAPAPEEAKAEQREDDEECNAAWA